MSQSIKHDEHDMARDNLARLVEQSAVRDMRAALAEAGMLDDEYHDRLADRWQLVNDAVDRTVNAWCDRREMKLENLLAIAAQLACEHPYGFVKAVFKHIRGKES